MKKFTLPWRIILALFCIAAVVAWSALCKSPPVDVRAGAISVLEQKLTIGKQRLDAQIVSFDPRLHNVEVKIEALEQILPQIEPWIAEKKLVDYTDVPCG